MSCVAPESIDKYRKLSTKLTTPSLLLKLRKLFEKKYTLTELLEWLHGKVEWSRGEITRHNDPIEILAYGKGRCGGIQHPIHSPMSSP